MTIFNCTSTGVVLAGVLVAAGLAITGVALADAPPWHQSGSAAADPNDVGTLSFYNSDGTQITGGSTTATPFAAYVVGSTALRSGDTKAALFAYLPQAGKANPQAGWSGSELSAASSYPNSSAPASVGSAGPLASLTSADSTLSEFVSDFPNTSSDPDYTGLYELRLRTSAPGDEASDAYDAADIAVSGNTWTVVYPDNRSATTVNGTFPSGTVHYGTSFSVRASVKGDNPTGTVALVSSGKQIGTATLKSGSATIAVKGTALAPGKHSLTIAYKGSSADSPSSSAAHPVTVAKAVSKTIDSVSPAKIAVGKHAVLHVTANASGVTPSGSVTVFDGSKKIASAKLAHAKATIKLPVLTKGRHKIHAIYAGSGLVAGSAGKTVVVTVTP